MSRESYIHQQPEETGLLMDKEIVCKDYPGSIELSSPPKPGPLPCTEFTTQTKPDIIDSVVVVG